MKKIATRDVYGRTLVELGRENQDIVVLDADLAKSTKTIEFGKEFPHRFFDMGIAEQNLMGTAAGLAVAGKIPFVSTFAIFATGRAFEQVRNTVVYPGLSVKIAATHAGITVGEDGGSHQSIEDIALMRVLPGMRVVVPADAEETAQAIRTAAASPGPFYIRLGRAGVPQIYDSSYRFELGKASVLRQGEDAAVLACGVLVAPALQAAEILFNQGVRVTVINISTIKPLDVKAVVEAARQTRAMVTAEEHSVIGGLGSAVAEVLGEHYPVPLERLGVADTFGESGSPEELLEKYGLTVAGIIAKVERVIARKKTMFFKQS
ncbi:MAG: transketolase family protein [Bacillota bacterium]